jgi:hypothetical protein
MESIFLRNVGWLSPVYMEFISQSIAVFSHGCENLKSNVPEGTEENTENTRTAGLRIEIRTTKFPNTKQAATFGLTMSKFN